MKPSIRLKLIDFRSYPRYAETHQDFRVEGSENIIKWVAGQFLTTQEVIEIITEGTVRVITRLPLNKDFS